MVHRDENGIYHGAEWQTPEDVQDDRDWDDEIKWQKEQEDMMKPDRRFCDILDSIILEHLNRSIDHIQLSLTLDAMTVGGRIMGIQIWKYYQKLIGEKDHNAVKKCLVMMPELGMDLRNKYLEFEFPEQLD